MGSHVSKPSKPKYDSHIPETWIEYGRRMDLEFAESLNEEFRKRQDDALRERSNRSVDDQVHSLIVETDIRVAVFSRWALNNMRFSDTHISSQDMFDRCMKPFWVADVPGQVIWRGIKDEKPNLVITRAIELGWEPMKTRLDRIMPPSAVDCGAITWNFAQ